MDNNLKKIALDRCKILIEQKMGWETASDKTHSDFIYLSDYIFEHTHIKLSYNTLKRCWGKVKSDTYPAITTLNALANIIGHENWNQFIIREFNIEYSLNDNKYVENKIVYSSFVKLLIFSLTIVLLLFIIFITIKYHKKRANQLFLDSIKISCLNPIAPFPHTVIFQYTIPEQLKDSIFLEPEYQKKIYLKPQNHTSTVLFYMPGYYNINLTCGKKIIKDFYAHAITNDWTGIAHTSNSPKVIYTHSEMPDSFLYLSPTLLEKKRLNITVDYWIHFFYIKPIKCSCDSVIIETSFKNNLIDGGISCFNSNFGIWGENGIAEIAFGQKGCTNWLDFTISEKHFSGKENDLSKLGLDLNSWKNIKVVIANNTYSVFCSDSLIFSTNYKVPLGNFKGIRYLFKGSGAVDFIKIWNKNKKLVYYDDFIKYK